jgi:hypothetical protein
MRAALLIVLALGQASSGGWLDRPLKGWNVPGGTIPSPPSSTEARADLLKRCPAPARTDTPAERALAEAGWLTFWNFDQQLVRDGIEIVNGMADADGMCRPWSYNIFVFVDGRFAGTLSPEPMSSRVDGSSGAVRIVGPDEIRAEFARYTNKDALCCPSARQTVRFRVDRSGPSPVVAPMEVKTTRSF